MSDHQHDENCGCGEHEEDVFILTDEDGNEHEMVIVYTFETKEKAYAVLLDRNDPESDSIIFRIDEEGEESFLVNIEDDAEWEHVTAVYEQIVESETEA
ncbi:MULTISPECIES: DUF1292 domain-containing protein [Paenibacillus]|jgi:uncharacterized protein YrzB (UPF0473 family)|uniref:UPF0473 protein IDH45_07995 n=1 Tax=Paenibacillus oceani TaxID=2772510 RepID=A0A927GZY1_9BACL|nr:DUF1292 domain-containing protein [Paenibacillus oceani]MBD2861919.1 DUF1292 domain-containing protein [Paenibacillus oceani]MDF2657617.1 hypothetical protein [Paenibacillus sp.]